MASFLNKFRFVGIGINQLRVANAMFSSKCIGRIQNIKPYGGLQLKKVSKESYVILSLTQCI
jgi:RecA/RadA recombinase